MAGTTTSIEDLHPDVLTCALRHMDGPTLATASCATSHLRSISTHPSIWQDLCLSTWPSLSHPRILHLIHSHHRSFFSDSFPFPLQHSLHVPSSSHHDHHHDLPVELISAVDLYHKGNPVFYRVIETDTSSPWFLGSPFRVDGRDRKDPDSASITPEDLTLSWIFIDPIGKRAVNVSSRRPVAVERHWYTGETMVRFVTVIRGCAIGVVVTCGEETGHVREVSLTVEDMDGMAVSGRDGLVILKMAMEGKRIGHKEDLVKEMYGEYLSRKRRRKEMKMRKEWMLDFCCTAIGVSVFLAFLMMVVLR